MCQINLFECGPDHVGLQVACSPRVDLDCLHSPGACRFNALRIGAGLDIALDHANIKLPSQSLNRAL